MNKFGIFHLLSEEGLCANSIDSPLVFILKVGPGKVEVRFSKFVEVSNV